MGGEGAPVTGEMPCAAPAIGANSSDVTLFLTWRHTREADFGGGCRGGTRPDDADGSRVRPVACKRSIAARSVALGANAARLSGGADSGLGRSDAGGSTGTSCRGGYRCCPSHWTAGRL